MIARTRGRTGIGRRASAVPLRHAELRELARVVGIAIELRPPLVKPLLRDLAIVVHLLHRLLFSLMGFPPLAVPAMPVLPSVIPRLLLSGSPAKGLPVLVEGGVERIEPRIERLVRLRVVPVSQIEPPYRFGFSRLCARTLNAIVGLCLPYLET